MRDISKIYRKIVSVNSDYQAFLLYERLNHEQQKQLEELCISNGKMFFFFRHIHYSIKEKTS